MLDCISWEFSANSNGRMDVSFSLWHLGLTLLIATIAFGFSVKAASRYSHVGLTFLSASLGIEALASLLTLFMIVLDPGKFSFLLWASGILRYFGLGLLIAGWILLANARGPIGERSPVALRTALSRDVRRELRQMGDPRRFCRGGARGDVGTPDDLRCREQDGPLLDGWRSHKCRASIAGPPSLFNRAGDPERPMDGRKDIRGSRDPLRDYESRLRIDCRDQLWIGLDHPHESSSLDGTRFRQHVAWQFLIANCN